jgi:ABC-type anion transport system duplicated permease subunit
VATEWNREWIESELRALRDRAIAEQEHITQRFSEVNKLREQVLQERGVFVRHETMDALRMRVERLEQTGITREDHERLVDRVAAIERAMVNRDEHNIVMEQLAKLQSRVPILLAVAGIVAAMIGYLLENYFNARLLHP